MNLKDMCLALMSVIEPGDAKSAEGIARIGVENFFALHPQAQKANCDDLYESLQRTNSELITPEDAEWPIGLNDLSVSPMGIIVKGNREALSFSAVAIVGTRNPTPYGIRIAQDFAAGFVDRGYGITSGGAYGIDSQAHRGALIAEGSTIAVIASGVDSPYPAGNKRLFDEIAESGAIVTEYLPGVPARPFRFLVRNRLIAALTDATIVIEAAFRSGSLRTARDAAEIFRHVFAIPGSIFTPTSDGCHRLIGERKAELVTSVSDAYELLQGLSKDAILGE